MTYMDKGKLKVKVYIRVKVTPKVQGFSSTKLQTARTQAFCRQAVCSFTTDSEIKIPSKREWNILERTKKTAHRI